MDLSHLPIIDWELATKLAGNKKELAEEMLCLFIKTLPEDHLAIKQLESAKNYTELLRRVHKLHGALCYCGIPRLKTIIAYLESQLKNNITDGLPAILDQLDVEIELLIKHHPIN